MKKHTLSLAMVFITVLGWAQTKEPNSVPEKEVRKKVIQKFKEKHSDVTDAVWHPYPNRYWKNQEAGTSVYFPIMWSSNEPDYYEVRFTDENGKIRKVYGRGGTWEITSRPITEEAIPQEITVQLEERGFTSWTKMNIENISKSGQNGIFCKIWLSKDKKNRILYFDETNKLVKTLKSDNDINLIVQENTKLKEVPKTGEERKIARSEVPKLVGTKAKKNHVDVEIIEWVEYTRVYDPFQTGHKKSYYDLALPTFYQAIFKDKSGKFVATYNSYGELLEVAQIFNTKSLPKAIQQTMKSASYKSWTFEKEHDKLEIDKGLIIYRIYGNVNSESRMIILDENGKIATL